jgi:hypothetical protein
MEQQPQFGNNSSMNIRKLSKKSYGKIRMLKVVSFIYTVVAKVAKERPAPIF